MTDDSPNQMDDYHYISKRSSDVVSNVTLTSGTKSLSPASHKLPRRASEFYIFAALLDRALGEFVVKNLFAAAVKNQFSESKLVIYYKNDRPYKQDIVALNPHLFRTLESPDNAHLPLDFFYPHSDRAPLRGSEVFIREGLAYPDIFLTASMMRPDALLRFEQVPYFYVPEDRKAPLDARLIELGLDPNRWFCCIYHREPTYKHRSAVVHRDVDPMQFRDLTKWIIEGLGGQVVRIGHPQMTPFPPMPGFVDLSGLEGEFQLHANAIARARFGLVTNSGPAVLFGAFGTPYCVTNAISALAVWRPHDMLLPRHFVGPDDQVFNVFQAIRDGFWNEPGIVHLLDKQGYRPVDNSLAELQAVSRLLLEQTSDVTGWRPNRDLNIDLSGMSRPETFSIPGEIKQPLNVIQFPEHAPVKLQD